MPEHTDHGRVDPGSLEVSGPTLSPWAWADWISEDIVQRLYALRQDLAEASLHSEYREDLRREILAIIVELRALAEELRSGVSAHDVPPPDLVQLLQSVSGALRHRPAMRRAARTPDTAGPQQGPDAQKRALGSTEHHRRRLLLQIDDHELVEALQHADRPLSALEIRSVLDIGGSTPSRQLTLALGDAVRRGVICRTGQRRGTRYSLPPQPEAAADPEASV